MQLDRLQNKLKHCKGIRNNTSSGQTAGIKEELDTAWQTAHNNEILLPNWQKETWQAPEEASRYVRPERVKKRPTSMTHDDDDDDLLFFPVAAQTHSFLQIIEC
jgi:hypothetical protein